MGKFKIIGIHIIIWILFFSYTTSSWFEAPINKVQLYINLSTTFVKLMEFYLCYLVFFPLFLKRNKIPQLIISIIATYIFYLVLRYSIQELLFPYFFGFRNYDEGTSLWYYFTDNIYFGFTFIILAIAVYATLNAYKQEHQNNALRKERDAAELAFLRSQINPHFLYNTLNYIYSLAIPVSDKLAHAIVNLSDLIRYTLNENKEGKVEIAKEIHYIENYIELFKLRFESRFYVTFVYTVKDTQQHIAPLLLIPFVENALKHGVVNDPLTPVSITLSIEEDSEMHFTVTNQINQNQKDISSGIGLPNVKRRLELIYPNAHQLDIAQDQKRFHIELQIKL
ncbi:sensor histidine kinase [Flavobacterium sp. '19STA2R22 D10 B1']|uniref:sensor histidine kinase n=1 Tax=Flavobacterium aerium TaxID=3037261 RepID=UPI00278BED3D|nr:histidine kinase [Flavobacterium sp. '19STA2R22 D10 B1']